MKRLFLDCQMGIAGDMLTATLLGLVDNPEMWIAKLNQMGIPDVTYTLIPKEDKGLQGYRVAVTINGIEESEHHKVSPHDQHNTNHHHHHAHHEHGETDTHEDHSDHHIHSEHHVHGRGLQG